MNVYSVNLKEMLADEIKVGLKSKLMEKFSEQKRNISPLFLVRRRSARITALINDFPEPSALLTVRGQNNKIDILDFSTVASEMGS